MRPSNSTRHFYPRPPRGGRLHTIRVNGWGESISIHALREEGDPAEQKCSCGVKRFLSTPSARRATSAARGVGQPDTVFLSTPSARRATSRAANSFAQAEIFLSTPSARRATKIQAQINTTVEFLSTPSARRATFLGASFFLAYFISIHALREEGDRWATIPAQLPTHFYPRPPRGGRPVSLPLGIVLRSISIHALREEGDRILPIR